MFGYTKRCMRTLTIASKKRVALLLLLVVLCQHSAQAENSISNSELSELNIWVRPGEELDLSSDEICTSGRSCTIFVDRGAKLEASNTTFGPGVTIYHADPLTESVDFSSNSMEGKTVQGGPALAAPLRQISIDIEGDTKELSNTDLETLSTQVLSGNTLKLSSVQLCMGETGSECVIYLEPGARLEASNSDFGKRVTIRLGAPLADSIDFSSVKFLGRMIPGAPAESTQVAVVSEDSRAAILAEERLENRRIMDELKAKRVEAVESSRGVVVNLPDVFFEFDKSSLTPEASRNVREIATILSSVKARQVAVEGHTDSVGSDEYNDKLSLARARSVRDGLSNFGFARERLAVRGYGEGRPVADNESDLGRAKNRRVEVILENSIAAAVLDDASVTADLNRSSRGAVTEVGRNQGEKRVVIDGADGSSTRVTEEGVSINAPGMRLNVGPGGVSIRDRAKTLEVSDHGVHIQGR